nr:hypothetical protein [Proteus mirabilis]
MSSADKSFSVLLGASPGASTAGIKEGDITP